jgi:hypothetical protein
MGNEVADVFVETGREAAMRTSIEGQLATKLAFAAGFDLQVMLGNALIATK